MRKTILATVTALAIGGVTTGVVIAQAQPAPPPPGIDGPPPPGPMGWMRPGHQWQRHGGMMQRLRTFALVYPQQDRKLTPPDVQKIAEAFLLWHGNHTWKVADVADNADSVGFAYTAPDGTVIAKFSMEKKTGHITRVG